MSYPELQSQPHLKTVEQVEDNWEGLMATVGCTALRNVWVMPGS